MKKLLLILLFIGAIGAIMAQINPEIDPNWGWRPILPDLVPDIVVMDGLVYEWEEPEIDSLTEYEWVYRPFTRRPITLGNLLDYRAWCYNDSTAGAIETLYKFNKDSKEYEAVSFKQEYYHLHYPQFDEFINWMEEKYKKK